MALVEHKELVIDADQTHWVRKATFACGDVVVLSQESDTDKSTKIEIGNLAGPIKVVEIPGSSTQGGESDTIPTTETRHVVFDIASDTIAVYTPKQGTNVEDLLRRGADDSRVTHFIFDADRVLLPIY